VDERYRKNGMYWDHQEFGGHYFRPMSAWAVVNAALGLSIRGESYELAPQVPDEDCRLFFSFGHGTARYVSENEGSVRKVEVCSGTWKCSELTLPAPAGEGEPTATVNGDTAEAAVEAEDGRLTVSFSPTLELSKGDVLSVFVD
jgi:hypothetical protein